MKYDKVKAAADIRLEGITVDVDYVDKSISSVTLTDAWGNIVRFDRSNSYGSLDVMIKAKPVMVKRRQVEASIFGSTSTWTFMEAHGPDYCRLIDKLQRMEVEYVERDIEVEEENAPSADPDIPF